jgi:uncharacterized protein YfdQ (DUF2303 family)
MNTKLTLSLDETTIEKAKYYAKENRTSLSELFENYLNNIVSDKKKEETITPLVKSLSGILKIEHAENHKSEYADYLINKYK